MSTKLKSLFIYVLAAAVSFFFGLFILDQVILPQLTGVGLESEVPVLAGESREDAAAICQGANLGLEVHGETYSASIPAGHVLDQDPEQGLVVKQGRSVYVILSKGPEMVGVPHVVGLTSRQAEILIENNFLVVDSVLSAADAKTARGRIVSVIPSPGTFLPKGSMVTLTVSEGAQKVRVPSLIDKSLNEARAILQDAGLSLGEVSFRFNRYLPAGRVIDQHPLERTPVELGVTVDVVVTNSIQ